MPSSTSKKVLVKRFEREPVPGFVNPATFLKPDGVEVLNTAGALLLIPYSEVKVVCFVRDFQGLSRGPEQKVFHARPRMEGLWVRMLYRDGETMDGLLANNLLETEPSGFTVIPPNPSSNNQRLFVPRAALKEFHVLAVIGSPLKERKRKPAPEKQMEMFE